MMNQVKVNIDDAVSTLNNTAGIGTVFRDSSGRWLGEVARSTGRCNALVAELGANPEGLLYAWTSGYRYIEVESDCLEAVNIVTVADKLAAKGHGLLLMATKFPEAPDNVREIVAEEMTRAVFASTTLVREGMMPFDPGDDSGVF
ncbi:hypothetical protein V6N13_079458 [Hibiscus sabdariffa]|uniref:RNase H type-1 domain-containing protein n=1 Tax=Hibiscus sabdariffa TaxID=183260 RepID=A0ABR2RRF5_9ROSI